eukprot:4423526-Pleurochrysis_carterae.AAC.1
MRSSVCAAAGASVCSVCSVHAHACAEHGLNVRSKDRDKRRVESNEPFDHRTCGLASRTDHTWAACQSCQVVA